VILELIVRVGLVDDLSARFQRFFHVEDGRQRVVSTLTSFRAASAAASVSAMIATTGSPL
jgi:hypothetical protein